MTSASPVAATNIGEPASALPTASPGAPASPSAAAPAGSRATPQAAASDTPAPRATDTSTAVATRAPDAPELTATELKYRLIDQYGVFYCPAGGGPETSEDEADRAVALFPTIQKESELFQAILQHIRLTGVVDFSLAQKVLVYGEYQKLAAVMLQRAGAVYAFSLRRGEAPNGVWLSGTISPQGAIAVSGQRPSPNRCLG